jgi:biotin synthase
LLCPQANIPATTALATLNPKQGREQGLCCGANIVMPNVTPVKYRQMYEIYPAKACIAESAETCNACMLKRIESIGRHIGSGRGDSPGFLSRTQMGVGL